jgi:hypothetical protein
MKYKEAAMNKQKAIDKELREECERELKGPVKNKQKNFFKRR